MRRLARLCAFAELEEECWIDTFLDSWIDGGGRSAGVSESWSDAVESER